MRQHQVDLLVAMVVFAVLLVAGINKLTFHSTSAKALAYTTLGLMEIVAGVFVFSPWRTAVYTFVALLCAGGLTAELVAPPAYRCSCLGADHLLTRGQHFMLIGLAGAVSCLGILRPTQEARPSCPKSRPSEIEGESGIARPPVTED